MRTKSTQRNVILSALAVLLSLELAFLLGYPAAVAAPGEAKRPGKPSNPPLAEPTTWTIHTVDSTDGQFQHTALALDSSNHPRVSYLDTYRVDGVAYSCLKYARKEDSVWVTETVTSTGCYDFPLSNLAMALDSYDHPHIAYHYFEPSHWPYVGGDLCYIWNDGNDWQNHVIERGQQKLAIGAYASLALDSNNLPHVSYARFSYASSLGPSSVGYAYYTGTTWVTQTVESSNDFMGYFTSLALDASDRPHMSYKGPHSDLKYAWHDGSIWHTEVVTSNTGLGESALTLDQAGHPQIAIVRTVDPWGAEYELWYAWHDGIDWHFELVIAERAQDISLALSREGDPHISYFTASPGVKHAYKQDGIWQVETVDSTGGRYPSSALDGSVRPHISYLSELWKELRYAYRVCPIGGCRVYLPLILSTSA